METCMEEPQIKYRYERKYIIPRNNFQEFISSLYSLGYSPSYPLRTINNLYFDNFDFSSTTQNIDGLSKRKKYRIRWYGQKFEKSHKTIEIKIKDEFLNRKENFTIPDLKLNSIKDIESFYKNFKNITYECRKFKIYSLMNSRKPTLLNSYNRMYFTDLLQKVRITIDSNLEFVSPITNLRFKEKFIIIEAKYDRDSNFINKFNNLSYTRYSKYVKGILQTTSFNSNY
jgi:SPX domain protein involved in polyphosphate accumulation